MEQKILSTNRVRLNQELAELQLHRGDMGVVQNSWHYPTVAYEVEFRPLGKSVRVLLMEHQVALAKE